MSEPGKIPWLESDVVQEVLNKLIDFTDQIPMSERTRPPGYRLSEETSPVFFSQASTDEVENSWGLIKNLEKLSWIVIKSKKIPFGHAQYEIEPRIVLVCESESLIRELLGREVTKSYQERWKEAVLMKIPSVFNGDPSLLSRNPIVIEGYDPDKIINALSQIPELTENFYIREISAYLFNGLSKVLDNRIDALQAAFGVVCTIHEKPIILHVALPKIMESVIFIENETTYQSAVSSRFNGLLDSTVIVWSSGFKASAERIRGYGGAIFHYTGVVDAALQKEFESFWHDKQDKQPVFFFGDLDYSGVAIFKKLREIFSEIEPWRDGYECMMRYCTRIGGHLPEQAEKRGQVDPGKTENAYVDEVLLPFIRRDGEDGTFVDQEVYRITKELEGYLEY